MNPMTILQMMLGKERAEALMKQWQSMTPEQQQAELTKINNMSNEEKDAYLRQKGSSLSALTGQQGNNQPPQQTAGGNRFNY